MTTKAPKCVHCGKIQWHHQANTLCCPIGPKHRTLGHTAFSTTRKFKAKKPSKTAQWDRRWAVEDSCAIIVYPKSIPRKALTDYFKGRVKPFRIEFRRVK